VKNPHLNIKLIMIAYSSEKRNRGLYEKHEFFIWDAPWGCKEGIADIFHCPHQKDLWIQLGSREDFQAPLPQAKNAHCCSQKPGLIHT
jgi:hypothetical protein